ncbi:hypothetical protein [Acidianus sp. HS-5]|uniref:hypothetical protein n=1 Tax=Acidianus sp. HS-5 TaxID=2886040 RepID=UPI001F27F4FD|nr:hypothetical protein [Acidianus sp. HS-5]BDC18854.1 hypothetical protein HS5_17440 [Acidianus sp. HS-5]
MISLRLYNIISIIIYTIALILLYALVLPYTDVLFYLASISINLLPSFVKHEYVGIKFKGVTLIPSKSYLGLYVLKSKKIFISSIAVDMPDVFLFIKYHEEGHSRQSFDIIYKISKFYHPLP